MKSALSLIGSILTALCIATVISMGIGLGWLWLSGGLTSDKLFRVIAVINDVDLDEMRDELEESIRPEDKDQVSHQQVVEARLAESLDLDLRETAMDKALGDLRRLQDRLSKEQRRYDQMKLSFDKRLAELEAGARDEGILALQRSLMAMQPKQAKDQIRMILEEQPTPVGRAGKIDKPMRAVVTVLKSMPVDKQKKIFGEFKTEEEAEQLHEILRQIRLGMPESDLYGNTRSQLQQFENEQPVP